MHRNSRYFDKNDGKHNFYGEVDDSFEEREVSRGHREEGNDRRHAKPEEDEKDNP